MNVTMSAKHTDKIFCVQNRQRRYQMNVTMCAKQAEKLLDEYESVCKTEGAGTR